MTGPSSAQSQRHSPDHDATAGSSPPTHCCDGTDAASPDTGPRQVDHQGEHPPPLLSPPRPKPRPHRKNAQLSAYIESFRTLVKPLLIRRFRVQVPGGVLPKVVAIAATFGNFGCRRVRCGRQFGCLSPSTRPHGTAVSVPLPATPPAHVLRLPPVIRPSVFTLSTSHGGSR